MLFEEHFRRTLADGAPEESNDDFRNSLTGAQEKDAFLWWDGKWMKPRGATPTTHLFKLPIGMVGGKKADFTTSVDNQYRRQLSSKRKRPVSMTHLENIQRHGDQRVVTQQPNKIHQYLDTKILLCLFVERI